MPEYEWLMANGGWGLGCNLPHEAASKLRRNSLSVRSPGDRRARGIAARASHRADDRRTRGAVPVPATADTRLRHEAAARPAAATRWHAVRTRSTARDHGFRQQTECGQISVFFLLAAMKQSPARAAFFPACATRR